MDSKSVLMIGFDFPPYAVGSGYLRLLGFARHLSEWGWDPIILSVSLNAYPSRSVSVQDFEDVPFPVHRAFALDVKRHCGFGGRYPGFLAQPDRWASWWFAGVWKGLSILRRYPVRAIWSTYPIMTAHAIAGTLSKRSHLPWIAEFRDPVAYSVSHLNPHTVKSQERYERRVLNKARRVVFTTPGALKLYAGKYPKVCRAGRLWVIENGYEEADFSNLSVNERTRGYPVRLVHSGVLYPDGRDPIPFFNALARVKDQLELTENDLQVILRASGSESTFRAEVCRLKLEKIVKIEPRIPYKEALQEQVNAHGLLLFQGDKFDNQIPAKLYEYLRIGRPILGLVGKSGDTASLLRKVGGAKLASINDAREIRVCLSEFLEMINEQRQIGPSKNVVAEYSRACGASRLAELLDDVALSNG